jgi:alkaline phosphatase D
MPATPLSLRWELSTDDAFRRIERTGAVWATPAEAHSVRVEVMDLAPGREYWYRFEHNGHRSPVGRTATAHAPGANLAQLRLAVVSCQHYEHGYYAAYRHLAARNDVDLVLHLGDYIYEGSVQRPGARRHAFPEAFTLEDYRNRYAQYRLDPALQAAHALCPWLATWDDHEVDNDYAAEVSEDGDVAALFLQRRTAAYQAWYEHLPVPRRFAPFGPDARIHTQRLFGGLANVLLLDGRQYRTRHACTPPGRGGAARVGAECAELVDANRTMLGVAQEAWLGAQLQTSRTRWNLLAQGTPMAWIDQDPGAEVLRWNDSWSGYPAARNRLMQTVRQSKVSNPVVLSGDVHAYGWSELRAAAGKDEGAIVAPEIIATSISSNALAQSEMDRWLVNSPELKHIDGTRRGYAHVMLSEMRAETSFVAVRDQRDPNSACDVVQQLTVEAGAPRIGA